jgi:hypothetical protein
MSSRYLPDLVLRMKTINAMARVARTMLMAMDAGSALVLCEDGRRAEGGASHAVGSCGATEGEDFDMADGDAL